MHSICAFIRAIGMNAELRLNFSFKGARNYVQGPDILDAWCDALAENGHRELANLDITFHRMVAHQAVAREVPGLEDGAEPPNAMLRFMENEAQRTWILEETDEAITERGPYDEETLINASHLEPAQQSIRVKPLQNYSNAEIVVALNKALLLKLLPEAKGKWLFTRLQLARSFRHLTFSNLEVRFLGHSNYRITRSRVFGDGEPLGSIFFSLLPAA
jgi:hypothetical protein